MQLSLFGHNLYPLLIILSGSLFLTAGDIIAKTWVTHNKPIHFALTLGLYLIGLICLVLSFRYKNIALASMMLIILNVVILALWSWIVYDEILTRTELIGLALAMIALFCLEFGS
jgi:multidrug transporter EmrE-like cation transporter